MPAQVPVRSLLVLDLMTEGFPIPAAGVAGTLAALLEAQGQTRLAVVVAAATPSIDETGYDNWNDGTYYYALHLTLPVGEYAKVEAGISEIETSLATKLSTALRGTGNHVLNSVMVTPAFEVANDGRPVPAVEEAVPRLWDDGMLRLFLSHVSAHKVAVANLKRALRTYGVSGFVAHEDIEPSLEWQTEIELALQSMHAMAALLTPEFHHSNWTDQEVGVAVGRGVLVVSIRLPVTPYGFIAKSQAMPGDLANPAELASALVDVLLRQQRTAERMREGLIVAIEKAMSYAAARATTSKLEAVRDLTSAQLARVEAAIAVNRQVSEPGGVAFRLRRVIERQTSGGG